MDYYGLMQPLFRPLHLSLACALLLGAPLAIGQTRTPAAPPPTAVKTPAPPQEALTAELFYEILVGEMSASQGDWANATGLMLEAARSAHSEQLYRRATELALQSRSAERALSASQEWRQAFPKSRDANRYVLQILLALNRVSDSLQPLQQEIAATPDAAKASTYLGIAQLYSRVTDKALAAAVVEQALGKDLQNPTTGAAAWATVGHLRIVAGQKELALEAAQRSHAFSPTGGAAALLALELMEAKIPAAEPLVQDYLRHQPSATIRMAYARVLMGYDRNAEALEQLETITQETPEFADAWLAKAGLHEQAQDWEPAKQALAQYIPLAQKLPDAGMRKQALTQAYLMAANIAMQQHDEATAAQWLDQIEEGQAQLNVQSIRANILLRQGKLPQARALIRALPATNPGQERLKRRAEIQLLRDGGAIQEAYLLQRTLLDKAPNDNDVAYETAILADKAGKHDTAESLLRGILERKPDYHHAYNALGYSLAERGVRLDEARQLIEKALEFAPNDPFILDSLGWVEFQQGNTKQALSHLEKAFDLRNDAEIAAHLGEVLWRANEQARARTIWHRGLQRDPRNETLLQTLKRLGIQP